MTDVAYQAVWIDTENVVFLDSGAATPEHWTKMQSAGTEHNLGGTFLSGSGLYYTKHSSGSQTVTLNLLSAQTDATSLSAVFVLTLTSVPVNNEVSARMTALKNKSTSSDYVTAALTYVDSTKTTTAIFSVEVGANGALNSAKRFVYTGMSDCLAVNSASDRVVFALFQLSTTKIRILKIDLASDSYSLKTSDEFSWRLSSMTAKFIGSRDEDFYTSALFRQDGFMFSSALVVTSKPERRRNALIPADWTAFTARSDPNTGSFSHSSVVAGDLSTARSFFK